MAIYQLLFPKYSVIDCDWVTLCKSIKVTNTSNTYKLSIRIFGHAKSSECGESKFSSVCVQKGFIRFLSCWTGCSQLSHFCIWEENRTKMCHPFEFEWTNICPSAKCRMHNGVNHFEVGLFDAKNCQIYTFSVLSSLAKNSLSSDTNLRKKW